MKKAGTLLKGLIVGGAIAAALAFGASQAVAGTKALTVCTPPPHVSCNTAGDCTQACIDYNGGTPVCQNHCCLCFVG